MLRRDYILKLIQDLFAAISNLLEGEGDELRRQRDIEALYTEFGADKDFFRSASEPDMVSRVVRVAAEGSGVSPDEVPKDELLKRLELLATLMYADFKVSDISEGLRHDVAIRSLALFQRVNDSSEDYSFDRINKINELQDYLAE